MCRSSYERNAGTFAATFRADVRYNKYIMFHVISVICCVVVVPIVSAYPTRHAFLSMFMLGAICSSAVLSFTSDSDETQVLNKLHACSTL